MKPFHRILVAMGALCFAALFVLPMWSIFLEAPQYPKGSELGVLISINKVTGAKYHDLENLNGLNHYIGMKKIEPDAIPELAYMPMIVGGIVILGLLAAGLGKRPIVLVWLIVVLGVGALGMYDFYNWLYDYGHDLDPHAAIKIPGMSYQPPIIGSKQLLNFVAHSYPAIGFYIIGIGWVLVALGWTLSRKQA
ncbi:MAG: hypothetical protein J5I53_10865 [Bradyrhizobiaceae bacterium]|nr:hypothetical protein [Bradyrhizobiaceae bacterium]